MKRTNIQTFVFVFRDQLKRNYNLGQYFLEVSLDDLRSYDENLADRLLKTPTEHIAIVRNFTFYLLK